MPMGQPKMGRSWWRDLTECGPLEKGMANRFSILAWKIPGTEKPGGLHIVRGVSELNMAEHTQHSNLTAINNAIL